MIKRDQKSVSEMLIYFLFQKCIKYMMLKDFSSQCCLELVHCQCSTHKFFFLACNQADATSINQSLGEKSIATFVQSPLSWSQYLMWNLNLHSSRTVWGQNISILQLYENIMFLWTVSSGVSNKIHLLPCAMIITVTCFTWAQMYAVHLVLHSPVSFLSNDTILCPDK